MCLVSVSDLVSLKAFSWSQSQIQSRVSFFLVSDSVPDLFRHGHDPGFRFELSKVGIVDLLITDVTGG